MLNAEMSTLLVVDVQERLLPHIHQWQSVLDNVGWLIQVARTIGVPAIPTEQYPRGLGHTHPDIARWFKGETVREKMHFSCVAGKCLQGVEGGDREQVVVCGIESHVCVLQTVLELRDQGREVFVVAEAIGSRNPSDKELAIERMRRHGAEIVSREMVAFEWLHEAGTAIFKEVSSRFLR